MEPKTIFLGIPTHDGRVDVRMALQAYVNASRNHNLIIAAEACSLLAYGFNKLYCQALNNRDEKNITWFAMLHSDVVPEPFWLDKLIDIAEKHDADLLSAVVPIKTHEGITSTAIMSADNKVRRLTMNEIHDGLPKTFSLSDVYFFHNGIKKHLLVNTGCMIVRLNREWSDKMYFNIIDSIEKTDTGYVPRALPEDWNFSVGVQSYGGKVMATTEVSLMHVGSHGFTNHKSWGSVTEESFQ